MDDDRAVLESLEAALNTRFEELARVETFDRPEDALGAIPRWTAEKRSIAVAVVDQKMPGMTGVELLTRLRNDAGMSVEAFHPARDLRGVVLTGYAGLESALAAKNVAGAMRYLEKPWDVGQLERTIAGELRAGIETQMGGTALVFREIRSAEELEGVLRLRYAVYASVPELAEALSRDGEPLDFDPYERVSRVFAVLMPGNELQIIGAIRIAGEESTNVGGWLEALASRVPAWRERLAATGVAPLPLLDYISDAHAIHMILDRARAAGERVVEPGRFVVRPDQRSRRSVRHIARHVIDSVAAIAEVVEIEHAIVMIIPFHVALYAPLGFRTAEGTTAAYIPSMKAVKTVLHGRRAWVPDAVRPRIGALAARFQRTGTTCLCPSYPECLPEGYASGRFTRADVLCPIRATEICAAFES